MNIFSRMFFSLLLGVLAGGFAGPSHAQAAPPSPSVQGDIAPSSPRPWNTLNPAQREVLAPLQKDWDTLPPRKQARMLKRAERWVTLPPVRREEVRQRIARWQLMTPAQRRESRENMRKFHQLSPEQREQLHATFDKFQQLPPEQREKLIREWHALPPAQRLHWDQRPGHDGSSAPAPVDPSSKRAASADDDQP